MRNKNIKQIADHYWNNIESKVDGYDHPLVKKEFKKEYNFIFDDELILALIYEDDSNIKDSRNMKIYSMLEDGFTFEQIKKSCQTDYDKCCLTKEQAHRLLSK